MWHALLTHYTEHTLIWYCMALTGWLYIDTEQACQFSISREMPHREATVAHVWHRTITTHLASILVSAAGPATSIWRCSVNEPLRSAHTEDNMLSKRPRVARISPCAGVVRYWLSLKYWWQSYPIRHWDMCLTATRGRFLRSYHLCAHTFRSHVWSCKMLFLYRVCLMFRAIVWQDNMHMSYKYLTDDAKNYASFEWPFCHYDVVE
jgi:hypothetical protein